MITFSDHNSVNRRGFLRVGGLGLGGLALPQLVGWKAAAAEAGIPVRDKSVVFLFMHGGPPQQETFDPKMDAPAEIRSCTGEVKTTIPGVTFGGTFEKIARLAHRMAIVRSFTTGTGNPRHQTHRGQGLARRQYRLNLLAGRRGQRSHHRDAAQHRSLSPRGRQVGDGAGQTIRASSPPPERSARPIRPSPRAAATMTCRRT